MFKFSRILRDTLIGILIVIMLGCGSSEEQGTAKAQKAKKQNTSSQNGNFSPQEILASADADEATEKTLIFYTMGLFLFNMHCNTYPTTEQGLKYLVEEPEEYKGLWKGKYIEIYDDPWGNPYQYKFEPNPPFPFDLRSLGPDGVESEDDIVASELKNVVELAKEFK